MKQRPSFDDLRRLNDKEKNSFGTNPANVLLSIVLVIFFVIPVSLIAASLFRKPWNVRHGDHGIGEFASTASKSISAAPARNFFIDIGTNNGESVQMFTQWVPTRAVRAKYGFEGFQFDDTKIRDQASNGFTTNSDIRSSPLVGNSSKFDSRDWNIIAVEANPRYNAVLRKQKEGYLQNQVVQSFKLYAGTAISTENAFVNLTLDGLQGQGEAGTTVMKDSHSAIGRQIRVKSLDIVHLLVKHVKERDHVFLKLDVEGKEYDLVQRLLTTNTLRLLVDQIAVEWHHNSYYVFGEPNESDRAVGVYDDRMKVHLMYQQRYRDLMEAAVEKGVSDRFIQWG